MQSQIIAVLIAGVTGTLANALAAGLAIDPSKFNLALVPGRYVVAILCAGLLPTVYHRYSGVISHIAALALLTLAPSLIAKFIFGAEAPWTLVLALNAIYAGAAWISFRALLRSILPRTTASE